MDATPSSSTVPIDDISSNLATATKYKATHNFPTLTHLTADSSWLLRLPYPASTKSTCSRDESSNNDPTSHQGENSTRTSSNEDEPRSSSPRHEKKKYYNILIDSWLSGPQVDIGKWFSQQWHGEQSKFPNIASVEAYLASLDDEPRPRGQGEGDGARRRDGRGVEQDDGSAGGDSKNDDGKDKNKSRIDLILISFEFTDHCHRETLEQVDPNVPVLATKAPADLIRSWNHFTTIHEMADFTGDWRSTSTSINAILPEWIGIGYLRPTGLGLTYIHSGILITFSSSSSSLDSPSSPSSSSGSSSPSTPSEASEESQTQAQAPAQAIIYTPHGLLPRDITSILSARPPIQTLAIIHGATIVSFGSIYAPISWGRFNLGAPNAWELKKLLKPRYWIATHDATNSMSGFISWMLRFRKWSREEVKGMVATGESKGEGEGREEVEEEEEGRYINVENGGMVVLKY